MRKTIATVASVSILAAGFMGVTPLQSEAAPKTPVRTIWVTNECEYEDGSGPDDTWRNMGCVFYSEKKFVVNFDGGKRWILVDADRKGNMPSVNEHMPVKVTIRGTKVLKVTHVSGVYKSGNVLKG